ncbi:MAG: hypothetical protein HZA90_18120 [Verrucomicrobia bacterium]|nr:hypothetical protein [Verrucomicrobiota bacterium]
MRRLPSILSLVLLHGLLTAADPASSPFHIRGTLPWHNFLSGPTAWDEEDYAKYLDHLKRLGLNYVVFHCYTGGAERYAPYVEPIIRIQYRDVLPLGCFDTSLTARWGYRSLRLSEFPFDTAKLFPKYGGADAFGAKCAVLPKSNDEHYRMAQALMKRVVEMAHERGIQVGIGFEFGIHPPEFPSVVPPGSWIRGANIPDPYHPASIEILRNTIDDLLRAYPGLDWVWLWLHEHTMHVGRATSAGELFRAALERDKKHFEEAGNPDAIITGVWSLGYIQQAHDYLAKRAPKVRLAISGWGGGAQLPGLLAGLDRALPTNIVFSCLNPSQGWDPQPPFLAEIGKHRPVWAIPWLEGDARLWHLQPRVSLLREHVTLAARQKLDGVLAIHWRTEEIRANLDAFGRFTRNPDAAPTMEEFYREDCEAQFGKEAAAPVADKLARYDREQSLQAYSPEYYPYDPGWGRLKPELRARLTNELAELSQLAPKVKDVSRKANLDWLLANWEFTLLLDDVSRDLEPAYRLKDRWLAELTETNSFAAELAEARKALQAAPVEKLIRTFARRVRSKGELGELSAINQKVWLTYRELGKFLAEAGSAPK